MSKYVFDGSALISWIKGDIPREDTVKIEGIIVASTLVEVGSYLASMGMSQGAFESLLDKLSLDVVELTEGLAIWAGFVNDTLSFTDKCSLALAKHEGLPLLTCNRYLTNSSLDIKVLMLADLESSNTKNDPIES